MAEERGVDRLAKSLGEEKAQQIKHEFAGWAEWDAGTHATVVCTCGDRFTGEPADARRLLTAHVARDLR